MGLLSAIILKGVTTAARNSTIKAVGRATTEVMVAKALATEPKEDAVIKCGKLYVAPTRSSDDYRNQNAVHITQELLGAGFENITLKAIKKLPEYSFKKYGKISAISINGNDTFLGIKKVLSSSHIVIEFLDFKDNIPLETYSKVEYVPVGTIHNFDDLETFQKEQNVTCPAANTKHFCGYCGAAIITQNAKFCTTCGKSI